MLSPELLMLVAVIEGEEDARLSLTDERPGVAEGSIEVLVDGTWQRASLQLALGWFEVLRGRDDRMYMQRDPGQDTLGYSRAVVEGARLLFM